MHRILTLTLLLLSCSHSIALEHFNPFDGWQTLESSTVSVTYKPEQEAMARETLRIAETALPQLEQFFSWTSQDTIRITLSDQQDRANGYASPLPYNRVVLYTPSPDGVSALQDYDDWLETLVIHELTHIIHLDKARDWSLFPRYIFGRNFLTFPNLFQPNFFKEGIATYIETSWDKEIGRGQNTYYDMVLRTEVATGILPLAKAQQNTRDWPLDKSYSYGVLFYQFLDEVYGQHSIQNYIETFSGQLAPFVVDRPARHNTNQAGLTALWDEYSLWLQQRFEQQIKVLLNGQLTQAWALSETGYFNDSPLIAPNGDVYFVAFNPYAPTMVFKTNAEGSNEALFRVHTGTKLVGINGNKLYYLQQNYCTHNSLSYDLYEYDLNDDASEQLSHCAHYVEGEAKESLLIAVKVENNKKHLVLFDVATLSETVVFEGSASVNISSPTWLNSNRIAFAEKSAGTDWRIMTLETTVPSSGKPSPPVILLDSKGTNYYEVKAKSIAPNEQDTSLLITSDAQNVIETWELSLQDKALSRLTQTLTGSTQPRYRESSNTLVYRAYTENGWNIHETPYTRLPTSQLSLVAKPSKPGQGFEANWTAQTREPASPRSSSDVPSAQDAKGSQDAEGSQGAKGFQDAEGSQGAKGFQDAKGSQDIQGSRANQASKDYNSLDTLAPQSWFFGFASDNAQTTLSLMLSGRDELNFHNWSLIGGRDIDNDLNVFQASYTAYNHLTFLYSKDHDYTLGDANSPAGFNDKARLIESNEDLAAIAHTTVNFDFSSLLLFAGGNQQERDVNDLAAPINSFNVRIKTAGIGGLFDSTYSAMYGISPSYGRRILAIAEQDYLIGSNATIKRAKSDGEAWSIDWHEYIPIYNAHTLALRAFHGYASSGADRFDLGNGPSFSPFEQNLIHRRDYPMRGYPDRSSELIGGRPRLYSADYRFPILEVDEGFASWPLGMKNLHGAVFYESGRAQSNSDYFDSAGAELSLNLDIGFGLLPVAIKAGVAQPFSKTNAAPTKDANYYFGFGYSL
jgi:hypothetical protein